MGDRKILLLLLSMVFVRNVCIGVVMGHVKWEIRKASFHVNCVNRISKWIYGGMGCMFTYTPFYYYCDNERFSVK